MPVCYSTMFSFSGRSVARVCSAHVHLRNNISKFRDRWQLACCALQRGTVCRPSAGSKAALKMQLLRAEDRQSARAADPTTLTYVQALSGRIRRSVSPRPPSAASTRSPWTEPPFAIAALQTSALRPIGPELDSRLYCFLGRWTVCCLVCCLAGRKATIGVRNLLRDWRARENAAPAADNIRRTWPTT